jgi:hypothetical protein
VLPVIATGSVVETIEKTGHGIKGLAADKDGPYIGSLRRLHRLDKKTSGFVNSTKGDASRKKIKAVGPACRPREKHPTGKKSFLIEPAK